MLVITLFTTGSETIGTAVGLLNVPDELTDTVVAGWLVDVVVVTVGAGVVVVVVVGVTVVVTGSVTVALAVLVVVVVVAVGAT